MIKISLTWFAIVTAATGPMKGRVADETQFDSLEQCEAFAQEHKDRFADWIRGNLSGGWTLPVDIAWKCEAEGKPA